MLDCVFFHVLLTWFGVSVNALMRLTLLAPYSAENAVRLLNPYCLWIKIKTKQCKNEVLFNSFLLFQLMWSDKGCSQKQKLMLLCNVEAVRAVL